MSLADELSKQPSGDGGSAPSVGDASPQSLADAMSFRQQSFQVFGPYKSGKTTFALSLLDWLEHDQEVAPEDAKVAFIDNDNGLLPLVQKKIQNGELNEAWLENVEYQLCNSWEDVKSATHTFLGLLREHQDEHGKKTAWLIEDNRQATWEWARDKFAADVYGMREHELAKKKRKKARQEGKRTLPTYDQQVDYGAINGMYNALANKVKNSGVNFVWLAPEKKDYDQEGNVQGVTAGGQKHDPGRVDTTVYLHEDDDVHYADLVGARGVDERFERMENPTMGKVLDFLGEN
jgi:hypothetical protein